MVEGKTGMTCHVVSEVSVWFRVVSVGKEIHFI